MQLRHNLRFDHWEEILTAIIEHDDYLLDFDETNYLTAIGTPLDFTLDTRSDDDACEHAERVYRNAVQKSQLVAMLIGRHLEFLYVSKEKEHAAFKKFFRKIRESRKKQCQLYGWNLKKLEAAYNIMRFCDRLSLLFCQGLVPTDGRQIEINQTIGKVRYFIYKKEKTFHIDPWPFHEKGFRLDYEFRLVRQSSFESNHELAKVIADTRVELQTISCSKSTT